jgi:hypothetical protein
MKGYKFLGYTPEERKKIHDWMRKVEPTGFTGMVPKGVRPSPPDAPGKKEMIYDDEDSAEIY